MKTLTLRMSVSPDTIRRRDKPATEWKNVFIPHIQATKGSNPEFIKHLYESVRKRSPLQNGQETQTCTLQKLPRKCKLKSQQLPLMLTLCPNVGEYAGKRRARDAGAAGNERRLGGPRSMLAYSPEFHSRVLTPISFLESPNKVPSTGRPDQQKCDASQIWKAESRVGCRC